MAQNPLRHEHKAYGSELHSNKTAIMTSPHRPVVTIQCDPLQGQLSPTQIMAHEESFSLEDICIAKKLTHALQALSVLP